MNAQGRRQKKKKLSKEEAWGEVATALGGQIQTDRKGKPQQISFTDGDWEIVLDTYTVSTGQSSATYTRVRALLNGQGSPGREEFELSVTRRNLFHGLARLFGIREVPIGYGRFDHTFFVRSNEPNHARSLLRGTVIGQLLLDNPSVKLEVKRPGKRIRKAAGEGIREIHLQTSGVVKDPRRLQDMLRLCSDLLQELLRLAVGTEGPVSASL
jgi:hypothetical protein